MAVNARANKRRVAGHFYGRFHSGNIWQSAGAQRTTMKNTSIANLLDGFDPKRHGGEAMAFAPVGREFGSPDYERDDGPLTEIQLEQIRKIAAKHLPNGKLLSQKHLFK